MSDPIVYVDVSEVREGALEDLKTAIDELVEFVDANESRPNLYSIYLSKHGTRMTVVQVHPDSASLELHMEVAGPVFRNFIDLLRLSTIDIYGEPSDNLLKLLHEKTQLLGSGSVVVHELRAGFTRFGPR